MRRCTTHCRPYDDHVGDIISAKDAIGGAFGRRSHAWTFYDGTGQVLQTQADFARLTLIRAQDLNDLLAAITADGGMVPCAPSSDSTEARLERVLRYTGVQA